MILLRLRGRMERSWLYLGTLDVLATATRARLARSAAVPRTRRLVRGTAAVSFEKPLRSFWMNACPRARAWAQFPYTHQVKQEAAISGVMWVSNHTSYRRSRLWPAYHRLVPPCRVY